MRFESKKILQPDPTNMENYLVSGICKRVYFQSVDSVFSYALIGRSNSG